MVPLLSPDMYRKESYAIKQLSLSPRIENFPAQQCQEFACFNDQHGLHSLHGLPSYEINITIYYISYCCRMVDRGLMVDRQKIETNIAHNFFSAV